MTPPQNDNTEAGIAETRETPSYNLSGRQLFVARALWVGIVVPTALIFAASVPVHLAALHEVCRAGPCVAGQLDPGELRALVDLGVSVDVYA
ncbi:MAG: hypothetical protein H0V21_10445, partial [Rubrobacter sp.]|nr:hypothetical protein [Rubrobacter sp.]